MSMIFSKNNRESSVKFSSEAEPHWCIHTVYTQSNSKISLLVPISTIPDTLVRTVFPHGSEVLTTINPFLGCQ
jgi:hypothetical protein